MNWLNQRISFLVILVGAIVVAMMFLDGRCQRQHLEKLTHRQWRDNNIVSQQRRAQDSAQITRVTSNYITKEDLRHSDEEMVKQVRKDLVGPIRTLENVTKVLASRIDSLIIPVRDTLRIVNGDTTKGFVFDYKKPPYLVRMHGVQFGTDLHLDYELKSEFQLETHWKKTGLFQPRELELIITTLDPAVTVDKVQNFHVQQKVPLLQRPGTTMGMGFAAGFLVHLLTDGK